MSNADTKCWICGETSTTGEHIVKKSDLRSEFGPVTQQASLYFHREDRASKPIGSLDARILKSPSRICAHCNNARTQPHDRAWETLSNFLRTRNPPIGPGTVVRANRVFPHDTSRQMLCVHLYFVKLFGCRVKEDSVPIYIDTLADAILRERAHPNVYLKFGYVQLPPGKEQAGMSKIHSLRRSDELCFFWIYGVGNLTIQVMFAENGAQKWCSQDAWHPRAGVNELTIMDFSSGQR
jgi:hypothetical protein